MTNDPQVLALKQDIGEVLKVFGLSRPTSHAQCPFCGNDSFSISMNQHLGIAWWKCHRCGQAGDVFSALKILHKMDFATAKKHLLGETTGNLKKLAPPKVFQKPTSERLVPVLDKNKSEKMIGYAHDFLLSNLQYVKEYKRGISEAVIKKYRIGLLYNIDYRIYDYGNPYKFKATWVLPITDEDGEVRGVKLHHQIKPITGKGEEFQGKCSWAPFGTEPKADRENGIQPNHSFYTLWPHPKTLNEFDGEFSLDPNWWLNQLDQNSDLYERWHMQLNMEQASVAYALGVHQDKLENAQAEQAFQNAYAVMGKEIRKFVQIKRGKIVQSPTDEKVNHPDPDDYIFIAPGELKALALESEGLLATAVTGGESWYPNIEIMDWFRGKRICLPYDDDITIAHKQTGRLINSGRSWAARMTAICTKVRAKEIIAIPGGQKIVGKIEKEEEKKNNGPEEIPFEI